MSTTSIVQQPAIVAGRKRKREHPPLILYCSTDEAATGAEDETDAEAELSAAESSPVASTSAARPKRYGCTYDGCDKAYTKPSRLEEHVRSHTGERPFKCLSCNKSYLRESHLHAHARTHMNASEKLFKCATDDCERAFWTGTQLKVHQQVHKGVKPFACTVSECGAGFAKHNQLRAHVAEAHSPPGTKPFQCEHEGCDKSFATNQKLTAHNKTHLEKRYACMHPSCVSAENVLIFTKWTQLQHHLRTAHPPTCPHPSCGNRTFANPANLRAHLLLHSQKDAETQIATDPTSVNSEPDEDDEPPAKRRRGGDIGRDWKCSEDDCDKAFKSKKALRTHTKISHLGLREFNCDHEGCGKTFGYKHLVQRHVLKAHSTQPSSSDSDAMSLSDAETITDGPTSLIDLITGKSYSERKGVSKQQLVQCPWPAHLNGQEASNVTSCQFTFSRAYDLRRHLKAEHDEDRSKEEVDRWVQTQKQNVASK
ncbi:hypothetical protein BKA62DRAFT_681624 [Auriculariales sp. MPI-PUGE-AT-0066]|nr:hypothetical protein BKA62DRAFT_681624 [Auriculariales sp. MPI-PUGE-AT-0066]